MKYLYAKLFLIAIFISAGQVFAQQSDYQIKVDFETEYAELKASVDEAMTVSEIEEIFDEISDLEDNYSEYSELLNNALHPDTFEGKIAELEKQANNAEHKLIIIEDKEEKLTELSGELSSYESEIATLRSRSDSLSQAIAASEQSEAELSGLVEQYRENLEKRDEFVLGMIDSLFATYKDMESEEIAELSEQADVRKVEGQEEKSPVKFIQNVIDENLRILESDNGSLQTEDYLRMYVVQNRFEEVWSQIGNDLATLYGGSNADEWKNNIDNKIEEWNSLASDKMWASMDKYLEQNQVNVDEFNSNESFYTALEQFVKDATDASRDKVVTSDNYEDFQAFYSFWNNKIKSEWGDYVHEGEVLTMSQISAIDSEVMTWQDESKPKSFLIPILFGVSLLTIIGLIVMLVRNKQKTNTDVNS